MDMGREKLRFTYGISNSLRNVLQLSHCPLEEGVDMLYQQNRVSERLTCRWLDGDYIDISLRILCLEQQGVLST